MPFAGYEDFNACVEDQRDRVDDPEAFCAWLHLEVTGHWPAAMKGGSMEEELSTLLQKALDAKLGEGWVRAIFPTTAIYVAYGNDSEVLGDINGERLFEIPWSYEEETGLLIGEATEVKLAYVEKRIAEEFGPELSAPIVAKNAEKRIVYGPVLVPGEPDRDGEVVTAEKIEEVAHTFLKEYGNVDLAHTLNNVARPVESYLMPVDLDLYDVSIPKGTWMLGAYVEDDESWQAVKDGKLGGFSVMGVRRAGMKAGIKSNAIKKVLLRDLGDEWVATHVSLVEIPAVPKAEFIAVKSKSLFSRLISLKEGRRFSASTLKKLKAAHTELAVLIKEAEAETKEKTKKEEDMTEEEIREAMKEALEDHDSSIDERIAALEAKVEEATQAEPEEKPEEGSETPAEKKEPEEEAEDFEALKAQVAELEAFQADVVKRLDIKPASKAIVGQDGEEPKAEKDFGGPYR